MFGLLDNKQIAVSGIATRNSEVRVIVRYATQPSSVINTLPARLYVCEKEKNLPGREGQCAVRANAVTLFPCYLLDSLTPL